MAQSAKGPKIHGAGVGSDRFKTLGPFIPTRILGTGKKSNLIQFVSVSSDFPTRSFRSLGRAHYRPTTPRENRVNPVKARLQIRGFCLGVLDALSPSALPLIPRVSVSLSRPLSR